MMGPMSRVWRRFMLAASFAAVAVLTVHACAHVVETPHHEGADHCCLCHSVLNSAAAPALVLAPSPAPVARSVVSLPAVPPAADLPADSRAPPAA